MTHYENIPNELKAVKNWVCWDSGKLPKNPYTGGNAMSNNRETWSDFDTAMQAVEKYGFKGVGFMFSPPYFGVDLDKCIDNTEFVNEFIETLRSYNEISTSGTGIHIICRGVLPDGARRKNNVEMYQDGRYFIMTGNLCNDNYRDIVDCTNTVKILHQKYLYQERALYAPREVTPVDLDDKEIIDKAMKSRTGSAFSELYHGRWQGFYNSQSDADIALCNHLAFWTQRNEQQIDRIFRSSGLMRNKWDEMRGACTYGEKTVARAVADCVEVYDPQPAEDDTKIAVAVFDNSRKKPSGKKKYYDQNDSGNAQRLLDKFGGSIKYNFTRGSWMFWTGKVWRYDQTAEVKKLADLVIQGIKKEAFEEDDEEKQKELLKFATRSGNSNAKVHMIKECEHLTGIPVTMDELDTNGNYLNCQNGIVNLKNGALIPHDVNMLQSKICRVDYDTGSGKEPKKWLKFLDDVTGGDVELQKYLQKCIGYSLSGSTREQCFFVLYGMGNNGKSTFLETLADMLGDYAANAQPDTLMLKQNNTGVNSDIARLKSARFVTSEEPSEGVRLNEGLVKQLTGGGKVTCRFLFQDEFEFEPEFKIWMATNHKPVIRGTDTGIWRRVKMIPFEVNIPKEKVDKMLKYKLRDEMPQILNWAVRGAIMYEREGLEEPACVKNAIREYKSEMDLVQTFIDACVIIDNNADSQILASELFKIYQCWASSMNEYEMKNRKFCGQIKAKIPIYKRTSAGYMCGGIQLSDFGKTFDKSHYAQQLFRG